MSADGLTSVAGMKPRATYYYKVKSGSPDSQWSDVYSFRAPYADGITRLAICGCR